MRQLVFLTFVYLIFPASALSESRYVSDTIEITMRGDPADDSTIIAMLTSGDKLDVMSDDGESRYVQVRNSSDDVGYVLRRLLTAQPAARLELVRLKAQLEKIEQNPEGLKAELLGADQASKALAETNAELETQLQAISGELARIRGASEHAIEIADQKDALIVEVNDLQMQLEEIHMKNEMLKDQSAKKSFLNGAAVLFAGLLVGLIISRLRQSRNSAWGSY